MMAATADAFLAQQDPRALVADVIDHPLGHQEVGQLGQAQVENGRSSSAGFDLAVFLISRWARVNFGGRPAAMSKVIGPSRYAALLIACLTFRRSMFSSRAM